ncbi:MAG: helix-turn-helix domain-containing protein [Chloroflexota bacterium]|nr:helix-turn-helix domain-containing protein [Chloroflexota bacterium]
MPSGQAKTIRELREAKGLTLAQLANQAHVEAAKLDKWERGQLATDTTPLRRIANTLGVTLDDIILPPHERLMSVRGHRFVLSARRHEGRWRAHPALWDHLDATEWPVRAVDPAYPDIDSPSIFFSRTPEGARLWEASGDTAEEALSALEERITGAMERALFPHRLPEDPGDWTPPDVPEHWQRQLAARRKDIRDRRPR